MAWLSLFVAGLLEIVWAAGLKQLGTALSAVTAAWVAAAAIASFALLALALRTLPVGPAYAVWTGIGIAGTALIGWFVFGERLGALQIASILLIALGILGLMLAGTAKAG